MNRLLTKITAAAGSLALAGAVVVLAAVPAAANLTGGSSSYGASAPTGLTTAPPQGLATSTGPALVIQHAIEIPGLLRTGLTLDTASSVAAYSRVASVDAQISGGGHSIGLVASQVASTCNSGTLTASANLIKPVLRVDGASMALPAHPTEGESFTFAAGTVTLNNQIAATGGGVEDQAVHIHFTSPSQDLYLAVTTCNTSSSSNTITVTNPGPKTNNTGTAITPLQIVATDTDTSQVLTYSATGLPTGLSINASTGVISGTPTTATGSPFSVIVTVTDTSGASGSTTFTWTIHNVVTVTNPGTQNTPTSSPVSLTMSATDSDSSITTFTWSATGLPTGLTINSATGVISGTTSSSTGTFSAHVTATDSSGGSGTANFTWNVGGS
jgi:hypothetical protein